MPLTPPGSSVSPELASHLTYYDLDLRTKQRFATNFEIPSFVAKDGLRFAKPRTVAALTDKALIPSIREQSGLDPLRKNTLTHFLNVRLPSPFAQGNLTIAIGDAYDYQYFSSLQFMGHPNTVIAYETMSPDPANLRVMISHAALFGSLPRQVLARTTSQRPLVLIDQSFSTQDDLIGYKHSLAYRLQRQSTGVIAAREIISRDGVLNNWEGRERETRRVIGQASEVFFLVD